MARTKQSARKSTGGKAPRNQILSTVYGQKTSIRSQLGCKTASMPSLASLMTYALGPCTYMFTALANFFF